MNDQERHDLDELEAILFSIEGTVSPQVSGFCIDTPDKASWAGRKIVEAESRIEHQKAIADEYKRRIDEWFERTIREDRASIEYLLGMLKPFAISEIRSLKKGKTLKYFGVSISMRKLPDKAEIDDETAAIEYCEQHIPEAVETKKTLSRSMVKKALVEGRFIPGVDLVSGSEELYVTGDKEHTILKKAEAA